MRGAAAWTRTANRRPSDYHKVLLKRLKTLEAKLHEQFGEFESRAYVDTGPVVERALATAAGLGWTGKNTCLIHPKLGSFGFLAVLLTSLDLSPKEKTAELTVPDRCGTCTRCLDACPTGALIAPYQMDATHCISYLTIEHKGPIAAELMAGMGRQVFGCDICQDVCPWNRKAPIAVDAELEPRAELVNPALEWLALAGRGSFRAHLQWLAGAAGGISGNAAQHCHRHGEQRRRGLCIAPQGVGRIGRRKSTIRRTMGAQADQKHVKLKRIPSSRLNHQGEETSKDSFERDGSDLPSAN